jgi:hypothetical protein
MNAAPDVENIAQVDQVFDILLARCVGMVLNCGTLSQQKQTAGTKERQIYCWVRQRLHHKDNFHPIMCRRAMIRISQYALQ